MTTRHRRSHLTRADQPARKKNKHAAHDDLKYRREQWRVHVAFANPGDDRQFHGHDHERDGGCEVKIADEIGQGVAQTAKGCHQAADGASSDNASAKPMLMPAPTEAASPTLNVASVFPVAKAAANKGASVDTEPSISPASPGWTKRNTNNRRAASCSWLNAPDVACASVISSAAASCRCSSWARSSRSWRIPASLCPLRGGLVKAAHFNFHQGRFGARILGPERSRDPRRAADNKAFHILPPYEGDMSTESLAIQLDQPMSMSVLFSGHPGEQFRRRGEIRAERFSKVAIDARVLFLGGEGEGKNLSFVQVAEMHALNRREDDRAGHDKASANPMSPGQVFAQEERGQDHGDHDAEFVHRRDFGCVAKLQGAEIAEPRCAGCQAGQYQEQPRP